MDCGENSLYKKPVRGLFPKTAKSIKMKKESYKLSLETLIILE
jgi:hypothetical protein